jgi:hypothetical protein
VISIPADGMLVSQNIPLLYECLMMDSMSPMECFAAYCQYSFQIIFDMSRYEIPDHERRRSMLDILVA